MIADINIAAVEPMEAELGEGAITLDFDVTS